MNVPLIILHIVVCVIIILIVLLQVGRGAEAGAMFGGTGQVHNMRGATTFIGKFTTGVAVVFMLTSFLLTYYTASNSKSSVIDAISKEEAEQGTSRSSLPADKAVQPETEQLPVGAIQEIDSEKTDKLADYPETSPEKNEHILPEKASPAEAAVPADKENKPPSSIQPIE